MVFSDVLQRFVHRKPISVMVRAILEKQFSAARLDDVFARTAQRQYTKELAFSTCAHLLSQVTLGTAPSVHAAFKQERESLPVSIVALEGGGRVVELLSGLRSAIPLRRDGGSCPCGRRGPVCVLERQRLGRRTASTGPEGGLESLHQKHARSEEAREASESPTGHPCGNRPTVRTTKEP